MNALRGTGDMLCGMVDVIDREAPPPVPADVPGAAEFMSPVLGDIAALAPSSVRSYRDHVAAAGEARDDLRYLRCCGQFSPGCHFTSRTPVFPGESAPRECRTAHHCRAPIPGSPASPRTRRIYSWLPRLAGSLSSLSRDPGERKSQYPSRCMLPALSTYFKDRLTVFPGTRDTPPVRKQFPRTVCAR